MHVHVYEFVSTFLIYNAHYVIMACIINRSDITDGKSIAGAEVAETSSTYFTLSFFTHLLLPLQHSVLQGNTLLIWS